MKPSLVVGVSATRALRVDRPRTIDFMGEALRVYATPEMVNDIEWAVRDLILAHLDPGEDSVGTHVEVAHLAPTPMGMEVRITVTVTAIAGRLVTCVAEAHDGLDPIGRGTHTRCVVEIARHEAGVAAKAKRAGV